MFTKSFSILCMVLIISIISMNLCIASNEPVDYVDPLIGTSQSRWMLFPGPTMPFGMVKLSPDNQEEGWKGGYEYNVSSIAGFSHVHSWTMGGFLIMPTVGELKIKPGPEDNPDIGYRSRFSHESEVAKAGYYAVNLSDYDIYAELTTTTRAGFHRYTFPKSDSARILVDLKIPTEYGYLIEKAYIRKVNNSEIEGYSAQASQNGAEFNNYTLYFIAKFSKPFYSMGGWVNDEIKYKIDEIKIDSDKDVGVFLNFKTVDGESILVKTGISLVSVEQARLNLNTEMDKYGWDFDGVKENAKNSWNKLLSKIEVEGSEIDKKKFYTNMYRAYSGKTIWSDVNGKYVDMCENIVQLDDPSNPIYGSDAFWNTFWDLNQLWTIATPDIASKQVNSLVEIYKKGGWLPKGPTGIEYSGIMVGEHEIALIVSAYQKGIRDFDVGLAYKAMKEIQTIQGGPHVCGGSAGDPDLNAYLKYGYVPYEDGPTSNTLDYAYDDWCVSQLAKALGYNDDYEYFKLRANYYKNIYNNEYKFMWMRNADGSWVADFNPFCCATILGPGWVEGNAWQYTYYVPHDVGGVVKLLGRDEFNNRLNNGFEESKPYSFSALNYDHDKLYDMGLLPEDFYEFTQTEQSRWAEFMAMGLLPINFNNQPNMQSPYLFNYSGKPYLTQKWVREIMYNFYGITPKDGWLGDEDEGQMGAWYVMSAIGLFEMNGGTSLKPVYEIGSPIFDKITIHLDSKYYSGDTFIIETVNNSKESRYIQKATLNGKSLDKPWFYHSELVGGGKLVLEMGPEINEQWGTSFEAAPPSMSNSK